MKKILLLVLVLLVNQLNAQVTRGLHIFESGKVVNSESLLNLPSDIYIEIPELQSGVLVSEVNLFADGFMITTSDGEVRSDIDLGRHFQGTIDGDKSTLATVSIFKTSLVIWLTNSEGQKWEITSNDLLSYEFNQIDNGTHECYTDDLEDIGSNFQIETRGPDDLCKTIKIYFECDYDFYVNRASNVAFVTSFVTGMFNQVAILYKNEQINVTIQEIKVWTTPDPYISQTSIANVLNKFRNTIGANFNGNLAHLLTTRNLGGGIAYVDVLCLKNFAHGVSAIQTNFKQVPIYSWTIEVVTHELGHNIGSWHTHSCNWPQGALDNCRTPEGNCAPGPTPVNGGTIMSYCHLTSYGINFVNGFGIVPGNHIRNKYVNAACLTGTAVPPSNLIVNNINSTSATLNWNLVAGVNFYAVQYRIVGSGSWILIDSIPINSKTIFGLTPKTKYEWKVRTICSTFSSINTFETTDNGNNCQLVSSVTIQEITKNSAKVYWNVVNLAQFYQLQIRPLSTPIWTDIIVDTNFILLSNLLPTTTYEIRIKADCFPDYTIILTFTTLNDGSGNCLPPSNLKNEIINPTWVRISWVYPVQQTKYFLGLKPASSNQWFDLGPIKNITQVVLSGLQPNSSYHWRVRSECSDWSGIMLLVTPSLTIIPDPIIWPNPTEGIINFQETGNYFRIYNSIGEKCFEGITDMNINISILPSGLYYIYTGPKTYKLIKN